MRIAVALLVALPLAAAAQPPVNLIGNPGFEAVREGRAEGWMPFGEGYVSDPVVRHGGTASIRCVNGSAEDLRGATYRLELNQKEPVPLVVTGWSRAEDVGGSPNSDYAIYVDLTYTDGTPLWGQISAFSTGTHDWQRRQVLIMPAKPVREAAIHALFRKHTGTAWFDDFSAVQLAGTGIFDNQVVEAPTLTAGTTSGWFARDVAADSPIVEFPRQAIRDARSGATRGGVPALGLRVASYRRTGAREDITVADTTGRARAITVYFVERFGGPDAVWWNDLRRSLPAQSGERANLTRVASVGTTGGQSLYPFGCVTAGRKGRMLGTPADLGPRVSRIGYNAASRLFYLAFDVALTGENLANSDGRGHGTAHLAIVHADTDAAWGFRAAAAAYYRLCPKEFERRAKAEGLWMPFTDPASVKDVQDFGFAYHEGDDSIASDDRLGILSFRYTEPMTWWMAMPTDVPRTYDAALDLAKKHGEGPNQEMRRWSQALLNSGSYDENGRLNVMFENAPWTNGAVWTLNPNPRLPHAPDQWTKGRLSYSKEYADERYGPAAKGVQDGEYLDSIEGWAGILDFRPESLKYAQTPPTFTMEDRRPVIPTWFSTYELAAYESEDLHRRGKLLMANATPWNIHAFLPVLDVAGTETNWLPGGKWQPDSDAIMCLRRTLCYHKPYLLLQNTDFDKFGVAQVERYFQRSMFYGVFPSMFSVDAANSPYWQTPRWYNRDRALFPKYIPIIKRLSAAGWEPLTYARTDNPMVYVERFGTDYVTVLNDSSEPARATLTIDLGRLHWRAPRGTVTLRDEVTGEIVGSAPAGASVRFALSLGPEQARALRLVSRAER